MNITKNTFNVLLLKGCVLFNEEKPQVIEIHSIEPFSDVDLADANGAEYLDNGGDSYLIINGNEDSFEWHHDTKEVYKKLLSDIK